MIRRYASMIVPTLVLAILAPAGKAAADDVLKLVPKDALGFVVVHELADADAKLQKLARTVGAPEISVLAMAKITSGVQEGLDDNGAGALVLLAPADGDLEPVAVIAVPVSDYATFLKELKAEGAAEKLAQVTFMNSPFVVAQSGNHALMAEPKHRARLEALLESVGQPAESLAPIGSWLAENDVTAVMMPAGVKLGSYFVLKQMAEARAMFAQMGDEMKPALAAFEMYEKMFKFAGKEVTAFGVGAKLDEQGTVHLTSRTLFHADGAAAKALANIEPLQGEPLAGLPSGPFLFAGSGAMPGEILESMTRLSIDMMKAMPQLYGIEPEQADKLADASMLTMQGMKGMSMSMGVGKPGDPIYSNIVTVMKVDDAKQFMANYEKYTEAMKSLAGEGKASFLSDMAVEKIKLGGRDVLKLQFGIPGMQDIPGMEDMMEKLFGKDQKMTMFIAAADETTVVLAYSSKSLLRQSLKAISSPASSLAADAQVAQTAAMLPDGAQWVGYVSPKGVLDFVNRIMPVVIPPGANGFQLPDFPDTPPVGFAAKAMPGQLQTHLVVPASVIKAIAEFAAKVGQGDM